MASKMNRVIGTHEIGIYFVEELFDAQDSLENEVIFASPAMQLEQVLFIIPGNSVETYELDSAPYVQSWSAAEQVVHGVPPSHLTTQVSEERGNRDEETRNRKHAEAPRSSRLTVSCAHDKYRTAES